MSAPTETPAVTLPVAQAVELCLLIEMEAQWENLRKERSHTPQLRPQTAEDLSRVQRSYEAFRSKLLAFNKKYTPAHVTDLLLNYPNRLGPWCRRMRDLYRQVEQHPRIPCPVHLLEKAYRWADGMAGLMGKEPFRRSMPLTTIQAAIGELEALARWCDELALIAA